MVCNRYIDITPLSLAIDKNYTGIVKAILKLNKINANTQGDFGWTLLRRAIEKNNADTVDALIAEGAEVNAKDNCGRTPLHLAARNNHQDVEDVLIAAKGIDVDAKDDYGITPIHLAVQNGHKNVAGVLIAKGANPLLQSKAGETPIGLAKGEEMGKLLGPATIKGITAGPTSKPSTSFFSEHKWKIALIADFAIGIGAILVFTTSLNIGIAVEFGCIIFGAIFLGAACMLSKHNAEVTVEQTPAEQAVPQEVYVSKLTA